MTSATTPIPTESWGKDHWSTLAYLEEIMVDGPCVVRLDPHMRQKQDRHVIFGPTARDVDRLRSKVMGDGYGSRLADGTVVPDHDDWDCVSDAMHAGFVVITGTAEQGTEGLNITPEAIATAKQLDIDLLGIEREPGQIEPGDRLGLTEAGKAAVAALRSHKQDAGGFGSFYYPNPKEHDGNPN